MAINTGTHQAREYETVCIRLQHNNTNNNDNNNKINKSNKTRVTSKIYRIWCHCI